MALPLPGPMPTPGNNVLVTLMVQKFLEESRTLMEAATENQNLGRMTDCVCLLEKAQEMLLYLAELADVQSLCHDGFTATPEAAAAMPVLQPRLQALDTAAALVRALPQLPMAPAATPAMDAAASGACSEACTPRTDAASLLVQHLAGPQGTPASRRKQCKRKEGRNERYRFWTEREHELFLEGLEKFGRKDLRSIAEHVGTRNAAQVRSHLQKYLLRLEREKQKLSGTPPSAASATPARATTSAAVQPLPQPHLQLQLPPPPPPPPPPPMPGLPHGYSTVPSMMPVAPFVQSVPAYGMQPPYALPPGLALMPHSLPVSGPFSLQAAPMLTMLGTPAPPGVAPLPLSSAMMSAFPSLSSPMPSHLPASLLPPLPLPVPPLSDHLVAQQLLSATETAAAAALQATTAGSVPTPLPR